MHLENMPLFEKFIPIIQEETIKNWTANDFWKHIKLTKKERNKFNRQRMYRVLRKLVETGFLTKELDETNQRLSNFSETKNIDILRKSNNLNKENIAIENKIAHITENIKNLNNKHDALKLAAKDFPYLSRKANKLRVNLTIEIENLEVYKDVLLTLKS